MAKQNAHTPRAGTGKTEHVNVLCPKRLPELYDGGQLTRVGMKLLLRKWKRQKRLCIFGCGRLADSIDHIIPKYHGGTSSEGNLAPACRTCNCRKGAMFIVELKAGRVSAGRHLSWLKR